MNLRVLKKMKEEDSKWEEELPSPEELIPLSQSLITPDLAVAFNLQTPNHTNSGQQPLPPPPSSSAAGEEPARTLKRPRLVWTPQLHKRFVDAVAHIGIKNAVPKTIMQLMNVDGLTRENVASHLQKYRLYLNRTKSGGGGGDDDGGSDHHLFSSSHVPTHFLNPTGRQSSDLFMKSFVSIPALHHHHHQQPSAQYHHAANFTSPASNGQLQQRVFRTNYAEDLESRTKTMLTLFPTSEEY